VEGGSLCKHCGAILPMPDLEGRITCLSCGRSGKARHHRAEPSSSSAGPAAGTTSGTTVGGTADSNPFTSWTAGPADVASASAAASRAVRRGMSGCVFTVLIAVVLVGVGIFMAARAVDDVVDGVTSGSGSGSTLSLLASGLTVIEGGDELISPAYDGPSNTRFVARVRLRSEGSGSEVVWRSDPLPPGVHGGSSAVIGDTVFAALGEELWALDVASGEARWKAHLPDVVHTSCDCFTVIGDSLVVQTADGQVFAYGSGSSEPRWAHRLVAPSGRVLASDAGLVVLDDSPEGPGDREVRVLDMATGTVLGRAAPKCTDASGWEREMLFTDPVYPVPGGPDLVATISFGGGCAIRWNGVSGQVLWSVETGDLSPSGSDRGRLFGDRLVAPADGGLASIDLTSGAVTRLVAPDGLSLLPRERVGDVLVAQSATTRGTTRHGLVGLDLATGQVRWQQQLPGGGELVEVGSGSTDALFEGTVLSPLLAFEDGMRLMTFEARGEVTAMSFSELDPATGELAGVVEEEVATGPGIPSVGVLAPTGDGAIVSFDGDVVHVGDEGRRASYP
jgi:outer membrane protein assembly factor BamB